MAKKNSLHLIIVILIIATSLVLITYQGTGQVAANGSGNFFNTLAGFASVYQATTVTTSTVTTTTTSTITGLTSTVQTVSTSTTQTSSATSTTTSLTTTSQTTSTLTTTTTSTTTSLTSTTQTSSTSTTQTTSTTSTTTSLTSTTETVGPSTSQSTTTVTTTTTSTTTSLTSTTQPSSTTSTAYPSVSVNPSSGSVGLTVQVSGSGFSTSDTSCSIFGTVVASPACSISGGALTGTFTVANTGFGSYTVTATGNQVGDSATATLTVVPTTAPAVPGFPVEATLAGLLLGTVIIALLRRRPMKIRVQQTGRR